ncbi:PIN domain-containing protein [Pseudomonas aeruginosa]
MGKKTDSEVTNVHAESGSIAVSGGINAPVTYVQNDVEAMERVFRSVIQEAGFASANASQVDIDQALRGEFEELIDEYRRKIEAGKARTALELFNDLFSRQSEKLSSIQIFRIKANIAICQLHLGNAPLAACLLHEACSFAPNEPKAIANQVLAFLLESKVEEAYKLAVASLKENPKNEWLAANALQAARLCSDDEDVYTLIADEVKESECVCAAHIDYLSSRKAEGLADIAKEYLERFPNNDSIRNIVVLTAMEAVVDKHNESGANIFPIENSSELDDAVNFLEQSWNFFENSERVIHQTNEADANNLLLCYALRADTEKLVEFSSNFIKKYPSSGKIIEAIVQISLDFHLGGIFHQAIPLLPDEISRRYKFVNQLQEKNWSEIAKYQDYALEKFDMEFRSAAKVATFIAQAKQGSAKGKFDLESLLTEEILPVRAKLSLYELAIASEIKPIIQIAYDYGLSDVTEKSSHSEILAYCRVAQCLHDWRRIVELLKNVAEPTRNCEETRLLALAYTNDYPIREGAVKFFDTLMKANHASNHLRLLAGIFSYKHKDFASAKEHLNQYFESGGRDAFGLLSLTDIARLENDEAALGELLKKYDPREIIGSPEQIIHLSRLLTLHGDARAGLELAFKIYSENPKSAEVALGYAHIFLFSGKSIEIESIDTVSPGVWFSLVSSDGVNLERIVDENYDDIFQLDPDGIDEYVRKVYGFKSGESFTQPKLQGDVVWTVSEIKHKYLRAFHYILANYEIDFPQAGGLWAIKMKEGDVQPILDFVKRSSEKDQSIISEFCEKRFPLGAMSRIWKKNTIKVSDLVRSQNGEIFTCTGTLEERQAAYKVIDENSHNGIVLDTYTAWVASGSKILEILKKCFGKVIVGRATIVELMHLGEELKGAAGSSLSLGWMNGQFQRTVNSPEERDSFITETQRRVKVLEELCSIESYDLPESVDKMTDQLIELLGSEIFEPYFIALKYNAVFCSDDFCSRDFAKGLFQLDSSVWLQTLLDVAVNDGRISAAEYCASIVNLAFHRHSHISLVPHTLYKIYENDGASDLIEFSAAAKYIGIENAEVSSHISVSKQFLKMLWSDDVIPNSNSVVEFYLNRSASRENPSVKAMKATSILLANVIRMPEPLGLLGYLSKTPALRISDYIYRWIEGHFLLSREDRESAEARARS